MTIDQIDSPDAFREGLMANHTGLVLSWVEYEMIRAVSKGVDTLSKLQEFITNKYQRISYSQSQYYRIAAKLAENGYLEVFMEDGRKKRFCLTDKGWKELGYLQRYVLDLIQEATIIRDLSFEVVANISKVIGCLRNKDLLAIAPQAYTLPYLVEACRVCESPAEEFKNPIFLALKNADKKVDVMHEGMIQYIDAPDEGDWLPKDESMDVIIAISVLQVFDPRVILREVHRVLRPGGYFLSLELLNNVPLFVIRLYNNIINTQGWSLQQPLKSIVQIENEITSAGFIHVSTKAETVLTSILVKKT